MKKAKGGFLWLLGLELGEHLDEFGLGVDVEFVGDDVGV